MRALPESPIFTRQQAWALGWSDAALRRAVNAGRLSRVRRGVFAAPTLGTDPAIDAIAAARACSGSVVSHRSAAILHGLPLLGEPPRRPDLTVAPQATGDTAAALLHRARLRPKDIVEVQGIAVTSIARTLADYARVSTLWAGVVAMDHARHEGLVRMSELRDAWAMCKSWPGGRRIAPAIELSSAAAESPLESCSRLLFVEHFVPAPELQVSIRAVNGRFLGRADFYWDDEGVMGEADGRTKYSDREVLTAEKQRQERMEQAGLVVVRWMWDDMRRPADLARRIQRALDRGARRDLYDFPRLWSVGSPVSPPLVGWTA